MSDQFFKIRPDYSPGYVAGSDGNALRARRQAEAPRSTRDFRKVLDDGRRPKEGDKVAKGGRDRSLSKKEKLEELAKSRAGSLPDPSGKPAILGEEGEAVAAVGGEQAAAKAEKPWEMGFIQGAGGEGDPSLLAGKKAAAEAVERLQASDSLDSRGTSPSDLFRSLASKGKKILSEEGGAAAAAAAGASRIEGLAGGFSNQVAAAQGPEGAGRSEKLRLLIGRIADEIAVAATRSTSDTTVTLKNVHPALDGSTVTVTTYTSAPREINVSFNNLTQAGMRLLDSLDQTALKQALDQKGFVVHMFSMSPIERQGPESAIAHQGGEGSPREEMAGEGDQQRQREEQKRERGA